MGAFSCRRKNPICLISQAKIWAAKQNLIYGVSYSSTPRFFPRGRISAARITVGSVRAVSYLDMKEGKIEEGGVKGRRVERKGSSGNDNA